MQINSSVVHAAGLEKTFGWIQVWTIWSAKRSWICVSFNAWWHWRWLWPFRHRRKQARSRVTLAHWQMDNPHLQFNARTYRRIAGHADCFFSNSRQQHGLRNKRTWLRFKKMNPVSLKEFCYTESERNGVTPRAIYKRVRHGCYDGLIKQTKINRRVIFVTVTNPIPKFEIQHCLKPCDI